MIYIYIYVYIFSRGEGGGGYPNFHSHGAADTCHLGKRGANRYVFSLARSSICDDKAPMAFGLQNHHTSTPPSNVLRGGEEEIRRM